MDSEYDRYIVVSFVDVTLVLSIGDTVEEAQQYDRSRVKLQRERLVFVGDLFEAKKYVSHTFNDRLVRINN